MVSDQKQISDKLSEWEKDNDPLAPLSEKQLESVEKLRLRAGERPYPPSLPQNSENSTFVSLEAEKIDKDVSESFNELQIVQKKIETPQQYLSWYSEVEDMMIKDDDNFYRLYLEEYKKHSSQCSSLINEVTTALNQLENLQQKYLHVSNKTNNLHEACEHLLEEQTKLANSSETISERLRYFNELDSISQKLLSPTLTVLSESFVPILSRLDECIAYLETNQHYKETNTYLSQFKHLLSQALSMIRSYVVATLQQTTQQVIPKRDSLSPYDNAFTLFYGKFRTHAPRIHTLMEQIEERVDKCVEYQQLLADCHQCYFTQRELLIGPSVSAAISELANNHQRDHCSLVRSGCAFLVHVCEDEYHLFQQFFSQPTNNLKKFLDRLCNRLYDILRPIIIHINHLETLAELCSILKVEMLEEHVQSESIELQAFEQVAQQLLEDVQERLVYRIHKYIQSDILGYAPAAGDLAYPEKLEMMESIAESLAAGTLSRASSKSSLASNSSSTFSSTSANRTEEEAGVAVLKISNSEHVINPNKSQFQSEQQLFAGTEMSSTYSKSRNIYSPADLHGMWYPTVRRTLVCLSKLYRCLDKTIFQGLSQEVLAMCIQSLITASNQISKNKTPLDGQLFQIKHLLILREQIAPFQVDFAIKETALDFSRVKNAAYSLLQNKSRLFSFSTNNSLLEFLLEGTPQVTENLIDSKKAVDNQLKVICEEFISHCSEIILGPLLTFMDKAKVIIQVQKEESIRQVSLPNQPFASPEKLGEVVSRVYREMKSYLPTLRRTMALYLANVDTEYILFRPIKTRIQNTFEQLIQLIRTNYTEEQQMIIAYPSLEQINILLSTIMQK
ncbi:conserved oligomeric Golgi complex subunit 3 [Centruroides vittatus]|uniref:conserved oligomeric Golgi complex subunit 3 n=1 Tax=Centruroides vittatus TaxID=120091 RepID=UPI00350EF46F